LLAHTGGRDIGFLTHILGCHFEIRRGFHVGPGAFRPAPKVRSTVVQLTPRPEPLVLSGYPFYLHMLELAFRQRRKTLPNACAALSVESARWTELLAAIGLPPNARAEALSVQDFAWLAGQLSPGPPL
jgi:16S rRNA (adenine1518-N6/adenine1519-N6)-dimethyltransferase